MLRFILMAAILLWHVFVHGYNFKSLGTDGIVYPVNMPISLFLSALLSPATYCFVFISGFFGIHFKVRKLAQLLIWCIFVSVIQTGIQMFYFGEHVGAKDLLRAVYPITSQRWWFMTAFVQLYVLSPILNYWIADVAKKNFRLILALLFLLEFLHIIIGSYNAGSSLMGLVFVYLLGRYFNKYGCCNQKKSLQMYISSFGGLFVLLLVLYYIMNIANVNGGLKVILYLLGFINPLIVTMAACVFFVVNQMPVWRNRYVNKIVSANLFIYLFTEGMGGGIYTFLANEFTKNILMGLFFLFATLIVCILGGLIIEKITDLILKISYLSLIKRLNPYG